jgi:hypothetical protein
MNIKFSENQNVRDKFESYPGFVRKRMYELRNLVIQAASDVDGLEKLEETLKWGEPSYITKNGSTIRMNWKESKPDEYAMYFHCQTKLVDTFKELYRDKFKFEGNRAIVFSCNEKIAENELKHCISIALNYHKLKHLPLLGA